MSSIPPASRVLATAPLLAAALILLGGEAPAAAAPAVVENLPAGEILVDGFELGSTCRWSAAVPGDAPPGADCGLASFGPELSFQDEGQTASPTFPESLTAHLFRPATTNTFVAVGSADTNSLTVVGGGVTVLEGQTQASVLVDGVQQSTSVTLTATLNTVVLQANVRVIGAAESPTLDAIFPDHLSIPPGSSANLEVVLDIPAPPGGTLVALAASPGLGTLPANVLVPAQQLRAGFTYDSNGAEGLETITATFSGTDKTAEITITP